MTWVKDTPRQPGWYWFQPAYSRPRVVEVCDYGHDGPRLVYHAVGSEEVMPVVAGVGRWSERIEPPRED